MATVSLKVRELAEKKGMTSAYQLKKALAINPTAAQRIWEGTTDSITFTMMAKLCSYFKVKPGSLFTYTED